MTYLSRISGQYTRGMAAYIMEETEKREASEFSSMLIYLDKEGIDYRATGGHRSALELKEAMREAHAIEWTSEYGYPVRVFWHWEGFEIRTAKYIGRNCLSVFPGCKKVVEEVQRQNQQVSGLIHHMSQEQIQHSARVDPETARRWMVEAEERDPMPEYDTDGTRRNRTHNRFGERVR